MATPVNREQFKDYCLRKLGQPLIQINIDDDQVEDRIDEALDYWRNYHHDATRNIHMSYAIQEGDKANTYISLDDSIIAVKKILPIGTSMVGSASSLFDLQFQIRQNDLLTYKVIDPYDMMLLNQHLGLVDQIFKGDVPFDYNKNTNRLYLYWNWNSDAVTGHYIIIEAMKILDGDEFPDIWKDRMLTRYATALIKKQWGNNMKKFRGVRMLGGIEMTGQEIYDEAVEEIKEIEQEIRDGFEEFPAILCG